MLCYCACPWAGAVLPHDWHGEVCKGPMTPPLPWHTSPCPRGCVRARTPSGGEPCSPPTRGTAPRCALGWHADLWMFFPALRRAPWSSWSRLRGCERLNVGSLCLATAPHTRRGGGRLRLGSDPGARLRISRGSTKDSEILKTYKRTTFFYITLCLNAKW